MKEELLRIQQVVKEQLPGIRSAVQAGVDGPSIDQIDAVVAAAASHAEEEIKQVSRSRAEKIEALLKDAEILCRDLHRFVEEWGDHLLAVDPFDETKTREQVKGEDARIERDFAWRFGQEFEPRVKDMRIRFEVYGLQGGYFYGMGPLAPTSRDKIRDIAQALHDWGVQLREKKA